MMGWKMTRWKTTWNMTENGRVFKRRIRKSQATNDDPDG